MDHGKPNVVIFNIALLLYYSIQCLFLQYNFHIHLILSSFIQFNSLSHSIKSLLILIQFCDPFNLIFVFIQINFYIVLIQLLYSFNSICNSFDAIFIFIQFKLWQSIHSIFTLFNLRVWVKRENFERGAGTYSKDGGGNARG